MTAFSAPSVTFRFAERDDCSLILTLNPYVPTGAINEIACHNSFS
jgi:hypothetical protein